jgi:hypothetical protein
MFYQGAHVARCQTVHAIGVARSLDGLAWVAEPRPVLSIEDMRGKFAALERTSGVGGVIEPAVFVDGNRLRMWFVCYAGSYRSGTTLYMAASDDGGTRWTIDGDCVLSSRALGRCSIHYPQVVTSPTESWLWFSVNDWSTRAFGICRLKIIRGGTGQVHVDDLEQVLPPSRDGLDIGVRSYFAMSLNGRQVRGISRLNRVLSQIAASGRNYFGYAHSHLVAPQDGRLYYHAYHDDSEGVQPWMDIGSCELAAGQVTRPHTIALTRSSDRTAWDAFFVADPFIVRV